jgi:hypothetical protein
MHILTSISIVCQDISWQSVLLVELMDYTEKITNKSLVNFIT